MSKTKTTIELAALREAALRDVMGVSDAELLAEAIEDGEDADAIAKEYKASMRDAAASALRQRTEDAKLRSVPTSSKSKPFLRPTLERAKQLVLDVFQSNRPVGLAFREGRSQTDTDWLSLYDDLVAMGAIQPDEDGV